MTVPEAAMDEDDRAVLGQDEVGFAGEGPVFRAADGEAEAEGWSMERRTSSGLVSRSRMRAMTAERLAGVKTSAMGERGWERSTSNAKRRMSKGRLD